jgi:hypothetical protein
LLSQIKILRGGSLRGVRAVEVLEKNRRAAKDALGGAAGW